MNISCPRSCLRIWSRETGSAVPSRVSLLISILRLNLVLTYGIPPEFRDGVHLFMYNRHTSSGQSRVYRVTQLRTDGVHCRESAGTGKPQGSSERVLPWQVTVDPLIFASLSHTHYWYEVGMLKVPAVYTIYINNMIIIAEHTKFNTTPSSQDLEDIFRHVLSVGK